MYNSISAAAITFWLQHDLAFEPLKMKYLIFFVLTSTAVKTDLNILKEYTEGNLKFTANVYKVLLKTNAGNFLVCPMSVETVFALVRVGAINETASQITTSFGFPNDVGKLQLIFRELYPRLLPTGLYNFSSANQIYVQNDFIINEEFKNVTETIYDAQVEEMELKENETVEEKTCNKMTLMLSKDIDDLNKIVIVNSIYFKANWYHEFTKDETKKRTFYLDPEKTVDVDTMEITEYFLYHESEETNATYLEMRFFGSDVKMIIILPKAKDGLTDLEEQLEEVIRISEYSLEKVHVRIPKFEMGSKIDFQPILSRFGVINAFTDAANFSGITNETSIKIHTVLQETFINVEELGTITAAPTAALFTPLLLDIGPTPPKEFFADHPFIYLLRDERGIMFIGRYVSNVN